jgi:uncharacterized membrane protein YvbJ
MKYCYNCRRTRPDTFLFCSGCGASFDAKYCRKLHANSPQAEYCHLCGSSDLSSPHKRPKEWRMALIVLSAVALLVVAAVLILLLRSFDDAAFIGPGAVLATASIGAAAVVIRHLLTRKR